MPNGERPRNHVTLTATASLRRIVGVINDGKLEMKNNLGVIDGDTKGKNVSVHFI